MAGSLQHDLSHAITVLQMQHELIESQQRQIQKLRIDLTQARETRAYLLTLLDDVGALRKLLRGVP